MKAQVVLTLLALSAGLAFAPAPLPRTPRRGDANEITVDRFQGNWRVAGMVASSRDGKHRVMWNFYRQLLQLRRDVPAVAHAPREQTENSFDEDRCHRCGVDCPIVVRDAAMHIPWPA